MSRNSFQLSTKIILNTTLKRTKVTSLERAPAVDIDPAAPHPSRTGIWVKRDIGVKCYIGIRGVLLCDKKRDKRVE